MNGEVEDILASFLEAQARGEQPDARELLARHPTHRAELEIRLRVLGGIDECFELIRQPVEEHPVTALAENAIPGFKILGKIGSGGMANVYLAEQNGLARFVVLKVMSSAAGNDARAVTRFRREAQALARLAHPSIVPVHEFSEHEGSCFLVLDFIPGIDLATLIKRLQGKPPPLSGTAVSEAVQQRVSELVRLAGGRSAIPAPDSAGRVWALPYHEICARLVLDTAAALHYAHQRGIIHRDVKPSNIILGQDGHAHLIDFGLVLAESAATVTRAADFLGTAQYGSPEQVAGNAHELGPQSDVFSLGVVLYELLTLERPFPGRTIPEVIERVIHKDPVPPRRIVSSIPSDLEVICLTALEKSTEHRYADASDLANDLRRFLESEPIKARRVSPASRAMRLVRRRPLAAAMLLATVGVGAAISLRLLEVQREASAARRDSLKAEQSLARVGREARLDVASERYLRLLSQGDVLTRNGETGKAVDLLSEAARLAPEDARAFIARAGARVEGNSEPREALEDLRRAEALEGPTRASLRLESAAHLALGEIQKSIETDKASLERYPGDPETMLRLGSTLLDAGSPTEALIRFKAAAALDPQSADVLRALGHGYSAVGDHEEAAKAFGAVVRRLPADLTARAAYAEALTMAGELKAGQRQFVLCLQLQPNDKRLLGALARNLVRQGRFEDALDAYKRVISSSGGDLETYSAMAEIYESLDRTADAATAHEKARLLANSEAERSKTADGPARPRPR